MADPGRRAGRAGAELDEVEPLAAAYNDPRNAPLLGHTAELSPADVLDHYRALHESGARQFLLYQGGALAGDANLRGIDGGAAEFVFPDRCRARHNAERGHVAA